MAGTLPGGCDNVIAVAASDARGHLVTRYSNFGQRIDILAPGGDLQRNDNGDNQPDGVLSTVQGGYALFNGTSMAAPHTAGVAALMLAADPALTPAEIEAQIKANAIARNSTHCPKPCGAGLLNAEFVDAGGRPRSGLRVQRQAGVRQPGRSQEHGAGQRVSTGPRSTCAIPARNP